ncbi:hypothetical protein ARMGADRAFT_1064345 [Armillaria gallica]|uniref:Uncharacterized protein n=1 Tax=Armillaria gallica TaxID=47427 RepID=A0A2H3D779_ARMGA|nr:hypothetical protein ARMGADRAFT_1064345 [Armillaria gallica]
MRIYLHICVFIVATGTRTLNRILSSLIAQSMTGQCRTLSKRLQHIWTGSYGLAEQNRGQLRLLIYSSRIQNRINLRLSSLGYLPRQCFYGTRSIDQLLLLLFCLEARNYCRAETELCTSISPFPMTTRLTKGKA